MNIHEGIEKLLTFAQAHLMLDDLDVLYVRNLILDEVKVSDYVQYEVDFDAIEALESIDTLLDPIVAYAVEKGSVKAKDRAHLTYTLLSYLTKTPSEVIDMYDEQNALNPAKALEWLKDYLQKCNFVVYPTVAEHVQALQTANLKVPNNLTLALESTADVENIIGYALTHLLLDEYDVPFVRSFLINELKLTELASFEVAFEEIEELNVPDSILKPITENAIATKLIEEGQEQWLADKIMAILSKRPSQIYDIFHALHRKNASKAFEWAYDYAIKSGYIRYNALQNNRHWEAKSTKGKLEITINTARKEGSDAEVEKLLAQKSNTYPACAICKENEGTAGKKTLRTLPLTLQNQPWFWQFSPYSYFNQHGAIISNDHTPMTVNRDAFVKMMEFCDFVPAYFVGVNAGLPQIGGSILTHDHFQSGKSSFPMFKAPVIKKVKSQAHPYMKIELLDWYLPVIRLSYTNKNILADFAASLATVWEKYSDIDNDIISNTGTIVHNGVAAAVRKIQDGNYCLDLILRNNRSSDAHPNGIFAAHAEHRPVKSESIGIIESLGHFILPGRLESQLQKIEKYLTKEIRYNAAKLEEDMQPFAHIIEKLLKEAGSGKLPLFEAQLNIKYEINRICEAILCDCAVFKPTEEGRAAFATFLKSAGIE